MKHIVLLGDSIFDNAAYVNGGPDVIRQLKSISPKDYQATLLAVDGSVTLRVQLLQLQEVDPSRYCRVSYSMFELESDTKVQTPELLT